MPGYRKPFYNHKSVNASRGHKNPKRKHHITASKYIKHLIEMKIKIDKSKIIATEGREGRKKQLRRINVFLLCFPTSFWHKFSRFCSSIDVHGISSQSRSSSQEQLRQR